MRTRFFEALQPIYAGDSRLVVLTGDLGYKLFDPFKEADPGRFFNMGVAEDNMIGVAAGLSLSGKKVYCYSIAPFLVMRPFEQIRIDIAYHNLDVKLVAVGGGLAYGLEGITHHGLEDMALMRLLPNMTVVVPADPVEAGCFARLSYGYSGPMYIRLGHTNEPIIHSEEPDLVIGKAMVLEEGDDVAIFATGRMVHAGLEASVILQKKGIRPTIINVHTVKPLDKEAVLEACGKHEVICSLEEHGLEGGLGSALAEVIAEAGYDGIFKRVGVDRTSRYIGRADFLREKYGLSPEKIADTVVSLRRG